MQKLQQHVKTEQRQSVKKLGEPRPNVLSVATTVENNTLTARGHQHDARPHTQIVIRGKTYTGLVDTGCAICIIGARAYGTFTSKKSEVRKTDVQLTTADGNPQPAMGSVTLPVHYKNRTKNIKFLLCPSIKKDFILGVEFLKAFNVKITATEEAEIQLSQMETARTQQIQDEQDLKPEQLAKLNRIKKLFEDISYEKKGLGKTHLIEHKIITTGEPIRQKPYPLSPAREKLVKDEIDEMLRLKVIKPVRSPWCNPVVVVTKKDGSPRVCLDSRRLNEVTRKNRYPAPSSQRILDNLGKSKYLTSIDLSKAYWQIPLEEASKCKTAFAIPGKGSFCYERMPFGICNASADLAALMDMIFGEEYDRRVFAYADDLIIASATFEEHITTLVRVRDNLKEAGLTVNLKKCEFCRPELKYLGYVIDRQGLRTDPDKIACVKDFPRPNRVKQVRSFLGLCSYYRKFIKDFSKVAAPLCKMTGGKRGTKENFVWSDEAEIAFNALKVALTTAPVLICPDFTKPFIISCDASDTATGAALTQFSEEHQIEQPIAYYSKTLSPAEKNYSVTERELLAVLRAVRHYKTYVEGSHFKVVTDHSSLKWLTRLENPSGRLARWSTQLTQYDMEIIHRKGSLNVVADALSRIECEVISTENQSDKWYEEVLKTLQEEPLEVPEYKLEGQRLYRYFAPREGEQLQNPWKLCMKKTDREDVMRELHSGEFAIHFGSYKTLRKLQQYYYWPGMQRDVKNHVKTCDICKAHKIKTGPPNGLMVTPKAVKAPAHTISLDLIGPLPRSTGGFTYILSVVDVFTKFCWLFPLRKATSANIVKHLEEGIFLQYGTPAVVILDNASYFRSKSFTALMDKYGIPRTFYGCVYAPQANTIERYNQTIETSLAILVGENQRSWDKFLPKIQNALNSHINFTTGFTPAYLMFGREPYVDGRYHMISGFIPENEKEIQVDGPQEFAKGLESLANTYEVVERKMMESFQNNANRYNLRRKNVQFNVGDIVWAKNHTQSKKIDFFSSKLAPRYTKCKVIAKKSALAYELEDMNGRRKGVYHVKDLVKN